MCTKEWMKAQNICFLYQNDACDQQNRHDDGNGNITVHCCAWCQYTDKGFMQHNNISCDLRSNPFKRNRSQGQTGSQQGGGS